MSMGVRGGFKVSHARLSTCLLCLPLSLSLPTLALSSFLSAIISVIKHQC